ncbi:MAG: Arc family DNA-binding protein [Candidatus Pacebacteria bacterium]|nr:Arc family DNA-binding protein [Candidatus Paceibacterota bacterium]
MSRTDPQLNLRFPADLKARLVQAAQANGRTMNAEIIHRLERSLEGSGPQLIPEEVSKAILETLQLTRALHGAVRVPENSPSPFGKKKSPTTDAT